MKKHIIKNCKKHGETNHRKRSDANYYRCMKCASEAVSKRRRNLKKQAVKYKGGKCKICDYNKSIWALTFHHLNPDEKDFAISRNGHTKSWKKIQKEIDKCVLLCHNCHTEVHHGITIL